MTKIVADLENWRIERRDSYNLVVQMWSESYSRKTGEPSKGWVDCGYFVSLRAALIYIINNADKTAKSGVENLLVEILRIETKIEEIFSKDDT